MLRWSLILTVWKKINDELEEVKRAKVCYEGLRDAFKEKYPDIYAANFKETNSVNKKNVTENNRDKRRYLNLHEDETEIKSWDDLFNLLMHCRWNYMAYVITNGVLYIGNKYSNTVKDLSDAKIFDDKKTADNVYKSSIPKPFKNISFKVEECKDVIVTKDMINCSNKYIHVNIEDFKLTIDHLSKQLSTFKNNKDYLLNQESVIDKMLSDVEHYIENNCFSAADGYKLAKIIQYLRRYRRKVKDELLIIGNIESQNCNNIAKGSFLNSITGLDNRLFKPRVLNILFEINGVNKTFEYIKNYKYDEN